MEKTLQTIVQGARGELEFQGFHALQMWWSAITSRYCCKTTCPSWLLAQKWPDHEPVILLCRSSGLFTTLGPVRIFIFYYFVGCFRRVGLSQSGVVWRQTRTFSPEKLCLPPKSHNKRCHLTNRQSTTNMPKC